MTDRDTVRRLTDILLPGIGRSYPFPDFVRFVESLWRFCRERPDHLPAMNIYSSQWRKFSGANTRINGSRAYMEYRELLTEQRVLRQVMVHDPGKNSAVYEVNLPLDGSDPWGDVRRRAGLFFLLAGAMQDRRFRRIEEHLQSDGGRSIVSNMLAVLFAAFTAANMDVCLCWSPTRGGPRADLAVFDSSGRPCLVMTADWKSNESNLNTLCELGHLFPDAGLACLSLAAPSPELLERATAGGIGMVCHSPCSGRRRTGVMSTSWVPTHSSDTDRSTVETVDLADPLPSGGPSRSSTPPVGCEAGRTESSSTPRAPTAAPNCS